MLRRVTVPGRGFQREMWISQMRPRQCYQVGAPGGPDLGALGT